MTLFEAIRELKEGQEARIKGKQSFK